MFKVLLSIFCFFSISSFADPQVFTIWKDDRAPVTADSFETAKVEIWVYTPEKASDTAVIICPGGGYGTHAVNPEGHGIAKWLNKQGISGIVLKYRLPKQRKLVPLFDLHRTLRFCRANADKFGINKNKLGVMGFSAGGHLASSSLVHQLECPAKDEVSKESARPDFGILIYPVITMGDHTHQGSKRNLLGKNPPKEDIRFFSTELQINSKTPPVFLAHAVDDKPVPPVNSELFHTNLKKAGVETAYLKLPDGGHGLNGYKGASWDAWQKQSLEWITNTLK